MNIQQINISYVQEQDRLLMRIGGDQNKEISAWITRRLVVALLPVLSRYATEQIGKAIAPAGPVTSLEQQREHLLQAFEAEAALRTGDFQTPYSAGAPLPMDTQAAHEPLLLTHVEFAWLNTDQLQLKFAEKIPGLESVRQFELNMSAQMSNGIVQLLHQSLGASGWLQNPNLGLALESAVDASSLPMGLDASPPKFLN